MLSIDHVQMPMTPGGEGRAREFYGAVLGMTEVPKPGSLAASGGVWFVLGGVELHLGIEENFRPPRKSHPAVRIADLDRLAERCRAGGHLPEFDSRYPG